MTEGKITFIALAIIGTLMIIAVNALAGECVPHKLAIEAWSEALSKYERPADNKGYVLAVCDPCSCPTNGMVACYGYLAKKEQNKID